MKYSKIGFIGGGRITGIILAAFRNKSYVFEKVKVYEPDDAVARKLKSLYPDIELVVDESAAADSEVLFLSVHPPLVMEVIEKIKEDLAADSILISLAPKISFDKMTSHLDARRLIRMIPNATSFNNDGYNPLSYSRNFPESIKEGILDFLRVLGDTFEVDENKLEAYAIVSAMLPTYFWFQWIKMEEIGVKTGLAKDESIEVVYRTLKKSLELLYNSEISEEEVLDLIPVKPIAEHEEEIRMILETKLMGLFEKIKP